MKDDSIREAFKKGAKKDESAWKDVVKIILLVAFAISMIIVAKNFNYNILYEDKVKETIKEMVLPQCIAPEIEG